MLNPQAPTAPSSQLPQGSITSQTHGLLEESGGLAIGKVKKRCTGDGVRGKSRSRIQISTIASSRSTALHPVHAIHCPGDGTSSAQRPGPTSPSTGGTAEDSRRHSGLQDADQEEYKAYMGKHRNVMSSLALSHLSQNAPDICMHLLPAGHPSAL